MNWGASTYPIHVGDGIYRRILGISCGPFGIHTDPSTCKVALTHIPSGLRITAPFASTPQALVFAELLAAESRLNWHAEVMDIKIADTILHLRDKAVSQCADLFVAAR